MQIEKFLVNLKTVVLQLRQVQQVPHEVAHHLSRVLQRRNLLEGLVNFRPDFLDGLHLFLNKLLDLICLEKLLSQVDLVEAEIKMMVPDTPIFHARCEVGLDCVKEQRSTYGYIIDWLEPEWNLLEHIRTAMTALAVVALTLAVTHYGVLVSAMVGLEFLEVVQKRI